MVRHQTEFHMVPNQMEKCNYSPNLVQFNETRVLYTLSSLVIESYSTRPLFYCETKETGWRTFCCGNTQCILCRDYAYMFAYIYIYDLHTYISRRLQDIWYTTSEVGACALRVRLYICNISAQFAKYIGYFPELTAH